MTEAIFQVLIGLLLVWSVWDLYQVMGPACAVRPKPADCYRWGEGPFADYWSSRSRDNYWKSEVISDAVLAIAICVPFVVRGRWMAILLVGFMIASAWWNLNM